MQKSYKLSSAAMLYAVLRLHKSGIYGVDNALADMTDEKFPLFVQEAEMELLKNGYATLNFDGEFELESGFGELVSRCADSAAALIVNKRYDHKASRRTIYLNGGDSPSITITDSSCLLASGEESAKQVLEFLKLSNSTGELQETLVESTLFAQRDAEKLKQAGCSEAMASLIVNAANGSGGYAVLTRMENRRAVQELVLLYGPEGTVTAAVEYTATEELFRLKPVTLEALSGQIAALMKC